MPPLTRQQTLESLRSWWSDRNPNLRGPTINLHAAAKPLMRLLYDRQALEFVGKIGGILLSAKDAEICGSYLSCDYVSASTKTTIVKDILQRVYREFEPLEVYSNMIYDLLQLLEVPKLLRSCPTSLYEGIFLMLENLASHESSVMAVVRVLPPQPAWASLASSSKSVDDTTPVDVLAKLWEDLLTTKLLDSPRQAIAEATCGSLVALVCDSDSVPQVVDGALWALSRVPHLKFPPFTTGLSVEAQLLDHIADMLDAPITDEWRYTVIFQILSLWL
ncbi:hypothetical protein C8J57DRAFT_1505955 [Mycena rebaudengoi]|nr:hypothetical protein C8J57DRAFT_1505955 [Mycena rebaudengoi]